jgi:hypothetical protein
MFFSFSLFGRDDRGLHAGVKSAGDACAASTWDRNGEKEPAKACGAEGRAGAKAASLKDEIDRNVERKKAMHRTRSTVLPSQRRY